MHYSHEVAEGRDGLGATLVSTVLSGLTQKRAVKNLRFPIVDTHAR